MHSFCCLTNTISLTGDRLKEATKINLSLSALGNVISALVDGARGGNSRKGGGSNVLSHKIYIGELT